MALLLADTACEVSLRVLEAAWAAWGEPGRIGRRLAALERSGAMAAAAAQGAALERVVRLTQAGRLAALGGRDPEACWGRPWDGQWRIVMFDVAEAHRSTRIRLTRQLRRARFGYLQDSVWITPDSVGDLEVQLGGRGDMATLSILEARPCIGATDADLVLGAWDFVAINHDYAQHGEVLRHAPSPQASLAQRRDWMQAEWRAWHRALQADPLLPEALLPAAYRGRRAWEARRSRLRKLFAGE